MSDHIKALFEGQELTEDFKTKATAIIGAAIDEQTVAIRESVTNELQEAFETKTAARLVELEALSQTYIAEQVEPQVTKYVAAAIAEWAQENQVALVSSAKVELAESFLTGLVGLAESHNFTLPQEKVDQVAALETQLTGLKESLNVLTDKNIELQTENTLFKSGQIVAGITATLSETQKEKFAGAVKGVSYKTDDQYTAAIKDLYESYFPVDAGKVDTDLPADKPLIPAVNERTTYESSLFATIL